MTREIKKDQDYQARLLKLIPSEIIAAYMVISGIIPEENARLGTLITSIILLILVPFYLMRIQKVLNTPQLIVTTVSFVVWVYTLGGPFAAWGLHQAWIGSIVLVLWTTIIPMFINPKTQQQNP